MLQFSVLSIMLSLYRGGGGVLQSNICYLLLYPLCFLKLYLIVMKEEGSFFSVFKQNSSLKNDACKSYRLEMRSISKILSSVCPANLYTAVSTSYNIHKTFSDYLNTPHDFSYCAVLFILLTSVALQPNYHLCKNVDSQDINWSVHIFREY